MIKGFFEKRYDRMSSAIYLYDRETRTEFTLKIEKKIIEVDGLEIQPTFFDDFGEGPQLLQALAQALQQGGYIPQSAVDAELKATKFHLEDMRTLALNSHKVKEMGNE